MHGDMRNEQKTVAGKPEGRRPLWRPRHKWKDNIKTNHNEIGCECFDWIQLAEDNIQ
jgi:hypothetical protein